MDPHQRRLRTRLPALIGQLKPQAAAGPGWRRRPADGWWTRFALHGTQAAPPVAVVISFIDCINRGDADGLGSLMTDDHELDVFEEEQLRGKVLSIEAWRGYISAFPGYVICPRSIAEPGNGQVAVLGHTAGSHLGLSEDEERKLSVIWLAETENGLLRSWRLLTDTRARRHDLGLGWLP